VNGGQIVLDRVNKPEPEIRTGDYRLQEKPPGYLQAGFVIRAVILVVGLLAFGAFIFSHGGETPATNQPAMAGATQPLAMPPPPPEGGLAPARALPEAIAPAPIAKPPAPAAKPAPRPSTARVAPAAPAAIVAPPAQPIPEMIAPEPVAPNTTPEPAPPSDPALAPPAQ
jgi:hypothetical protein